MKHWFGSDSGLFLSLLFHIGSNSKMPAADDPTLMNSALLRAKPIRVKWRWQAGYSRVTIL